MPPQDADDRSPSKLQADDRLERPISHDKSQRPRLFHATIAPMDSDEEQPNTEVATMRVMIIVRATKNSEAGEMPSDKLLADMGNYNEDLVKAGVLLAGEGLHPSSKGKRVHFSQGDRSVIDGPFPHSEVIAGFWLWQVKSMDEAIAWVRRCPDPMPGETAVIEIRPLFEAEDFGEALTPELHAQEDRMREEVARRTTS